MAENEDFHWSRFPDEGQTFLWSGRYSAESNDCFGHSRTVHRISDGEIIYGSPPCGCPGERIERRASDVKRGGLPGFRRALD